MVRIDRHTSEQPKKYQHLALSDVKLRSLKGIGKTQKLSDGAGLHIVVTPKGSRLWRLAYRYQGKQKLLALGQYPLVSLSDARVATESARQLLRSGEDPSEVRRADKRKKVVSAGHTFRSVAEEWFVIQRAKWVEGYADRLRTRLDADLLPMLGARPIAAIEPMEVLDVIRLIEKRDAIEMARRVMQMASAIFRYGVATSRCPRDPTSDLRGALKAREPAKTRSALRPRNFPAFSRASEAMTAMNQLA